MSVNQGNHSWKFGGEVSYEKIVHDTLLDNYGVFSFNGSKTGNAYADFLLGLPGHDDAGRAGAEDRQRLVPQPVRAGRLARAPPPDPEPRPALRPAVPVHGPRGPQAGLRARREVAGVADRPRGAALPGRPRASAGASWRPTPTTSRPRVGFAWDPWGDGKTSVRGAFGMFYGSITGNEWNTTADNQPFAIRQSFPQVYTLSDPYRNTPGGNPFPFLYDPASPSFRYPAQVFGPSLDFVWPYTYQMNLTVQREFLRDYSLSASYVGALGRKLPASVDRNYPVYGPGATTGNVNTRRPYQPGVIGAARVLESAFASDYHGLQLAAEKRGAHFSAKAYYTFSKALEDTEYQGGGLPAFQNSNRLELERGRTSNDRTHVFVLSAVWRIDYVREGSSLVKGAAERLDAVRHRPAAERLAAHHRLGARPQPGRPDQRPRRHHRRPRARQRAAARGADRGLVRHDGLRPAGGRHRRHRRPQHHRRARLPQRRPRAVPRRPPRRAVHAPAAGGGDERLQHRQPVEPGHRPQRPHDLRQDPHGRRHAADPAGRPALVLGSVPSLWPPGRLPCRPGGAVLAAGRWRSRAAGRRIRPMRTALRIATVALAAALPAAPALAAPPARPNVVFILADDLGYGDLGAYGQKLIRTPHLDRLAAEGLRFTDFYAGSTVCAPSRAVLMTGRHTGHASVRGNAGGGAHSIQTLRAGERTLAHLFKDAGYATALFGKWGLGETGSPGHPNRMGFDAFFGYLNQRHAHNYYPSFLFRDEARVPLRNVPEKEDEEGAGWARTRVEYSHDVIVDAALRWVDENRAKPFFLYLAVTLPHANNEAKAGTGDGQEVPDYGEYAREPWPNPDKGQAAMISRLDRDVGRLLAKLEELGLAKDTLVLFSSDNGPHQEGGNDPDCFDANGPLPRPEARPLRGRHPRAADRALAGADRARVRSRLTSATSATSSRRSRRCSAGPFLPGLDSVSLLPTLTGQPGEPEGPRVPLLGVLRAGRAPGRALRPLEGHPGADEDGPRAAVRPVEGRGRERGPRERPGRTWSPGPRGTWTRPTSPTRSGRCGSQGRPSWEPCPGPLAGKAVASYVLRRPWCASFELTHNCNARCHHCHRGEHVVETLATPQKLLEVCRELQPLVAILSGGEPLMRHDLLEIVRTLKAGCAPLRVFLNTNGALLTRPGSTTWWTPGWTRSSSRSTTPTSATTASGQIPGLFGRIRALVGELPPAGAAARGPHHRPSRRELPGGPGRRPPRPRLGCQRELQRLHGAADERHVPARLRRRRRRPSAQVVEELIAFKRAHGNVLTSDWVLRQMVRFFANGGRLGRCRAGERMVVVNPDGTLSPCGLLVRDYRTHDELKREFTARNECSACYTSTRGNSERPARYIFGDHIGYLRRRAEA